MAQKESKFHQGYREGKLDGLREVRKILDEKINKLSIEHEELYPELYDRR
jgi:hypothetical protein